MKENSQMYAFLLPKKKKSLFYYYVREMLWIKNTPLTELADRPGKKRVM